MADQKISGLNECTAPINTDIFVIVDDFGFSPVTKYVTIANALKDIDIAGAISVPATEKISLDGSTASTYIIESANDIFDIYTGGTKALTIDGSQDIKVVAGYLSIPATEKLYFDGANDTYIYESGADVLDTYVGSVIAQKITESGTNITGILYDAWSITGGFAVTGGTVGISITGTTNTANALIIGANNTSSGDFIIYGQVTDSYMHYDSTMTNKNKGRLIVANSSARFTLKHTINPCAVAITQTVDEHTVVGGHGLWSRMVIGSSYNVTSTDYAHFVGVHGRVVIDGTLDGTGVNVYGVLGEIGGGGTQTVCNIVAAVAAKYDNAINPDAGDNCLYYGWSHDGVVDYGLFLESTGPGSITTGINIGTCATHAISVSAAQTGSAYHVGDTWKLGFADGAINIGGDSTIAFGSVDDSICVERVDVSAQMGATGKYVMGKYQTLATSGAGAGSALLHGIWMGDYTKITIADDTTDAYAVRGRVDISTNAVEGNMMVGVMGSVDVKSAFTAESGGAVKGGDFAIYSSGSGTCNGYAAAVWADMTGNEIHLAGNMAAVWARLCDDGYSDYLLYAHVGNNNLQVAAIGIVSTDSAVIPVGVLFAGGDGSITSAMTFTGATTYFADFDDSTDTSPFTKTSTHFHGTCSGLIKVLDQEGVAGYINVWTT